jgi:hypothetical protein
MRKSVTILLIATLLAPVAGAQAPDLLGSLLATSEIKAVSKPNRLDGFIEKMESKRYSDLYFLKVLFRKTHQQFLRHYQAYTDFGNIFANGEYDCLTATSLLAVLLDTLHYEYSIFETNYHIFIIVKTSEGNVLLESTDPINGFEANAEHIEERINRYLNDALLANADEGDDYYHFQAQIFREVQPHQLAGLLFFNQAVRSFNAQDLVKATGHLNRANAIYENERNKELAALIILAAENSGLSQREKEEIQASLFEVVKEVIVSAN